MALIIAKLTPNPDYVSGNKKVKFRTLTFDSSYDTAGESLTAANVNLKKIVDVQLNPLKNSGGTAGWIGVYDYTNSKVIVLTGSNAGGSGTALPEVSSTTNLSSYTCRARIEGY